MNIEHTTSCKKAGLVTIRHKDLQDLTMDLLANLCSDVEVEPELLTVTGKSLEKRARHTIKGDLGAGRRSTF